MGCVTNGDSLKRENRSAPASEKIIGKEDDANLLCGKAYSRSRGFGMLRRLTEYLGAKPRRAAMIVMTLVVVLILIVAGNLFQLLNIGRYFESPYPSETTPLSLVNNGVKWEGFLVFQGSNYSKYVFYWNLGDSSGAIGGHVAFESQQAQLSSGSAATVIMTVAQAADMSYWFNLSITDSIGDGVPGSGDYIIFTGPPQESDTVYTLALAYVGGVGAGFGSGGSEYSYAIHDGRFYSWMSDRVHTGTPWWYRYIQ